MYKKITLLLLIAVSSSVFAFDVSNFDIKGIKLGMNKSDVLKYMPCNNPKVEGDSYYSASKGNHISCNGLDVYTDFNDKAYYIILNKKFSVEPNWSAIEYRLFDKYGHTSQVSDASDSRYYDRKSYCCGDCFERSTGDYNFSDWATGVIASYTHSFSGSEKGNNDLSISLMDGERKLKHKKWAKNEERQKAYKASNASDVDF